MAFPSPLSLSTRCSAGVPVLSNQVERQSHVRSCDNKRTVFGCLTRRCSWDLRLHDEHEETPLNHTPRMTTSDVSSHASDTFPNVLAGPEYSHNLESNTSFS